MKDKIKHEIRLLYSVKEHAQKKGQKMYLDMVKGIAILLVVLGHNSAVGIRTNIWLSTFHLPAFFIVSGILMHLKREEDISLKDTFRKKVNRILIPYFWFSVGTVLFLLLNIFAGKLTWQVLHQLIWQTISLQGYSVMWFLPVLFFAELYVILLLKILERMCGKGRYLPGFLCVIATLLALLAYDCYKNSIVPVVPVMVADEIRAFVKAIIAGVFISYGYLIGVLFSQSEERKPEGTKRSVYRVAEFGLGLILSIVNLVAVPHVQLMDVNNLNVGSLHIYLLLGVGGSLGVLLICRNIPCIPLLAYYGQNSLIIMCTHLNFQVLYVALVLGQFVAARLPGNYVRWWCLSSMVLVVILQIPVTILIKVCFPFMLGGRRIQKGRP